LSKTRPCTRRRLDAANDAGSTEQNETA
jgi:hypothetical protein